MRSYVCAHCIYRSDTVTAFVMIRFIKQERHNSAYLTCVYGFTSQLY